MPQLTLAKIKRAGAWLTAVCAIAYTAFSLLDIGLHLHEGWTEGAQQRDMLHAARSDCAANRFTSFALQKQCAQINATPIPAPWRVAMHHVGHHLREKLASALRSIVMLVALLVPLAAGVFYCAYRHAPHRGAPTQQHLHDFFATLLQGADPDDGLRRRRPQHVVIDTQERAAPVLVDTAARPTQTVINVDSVNKRAPKKFQYAGFIFPHHKQANDDNNKRKH